MLTFFLHHIQRSSAEFALKHVFLNKASCASFSLLHTRISHYGKNQLHSSFFLIIVFLPLLPVVINAEATFEVNFLSLFFCLSPSVFLCLSQNNFVISQSIVKRGHIYFPLYNCVCSIACTPSHSECMLHCSGLV